MSTRTRIGCMNGLMGMIACAGLACGAMGQADAHDAARSMEMVAGLDLGLNHSVTPSDYRFAMHMLDLAHGVDPSDADLGRSVAEAAFNAGEHEKLIEATRGVLRADPKDTVAQLRLISAIVNRAQTVEDRIEALGRFVGDGGSTIDESVRSRLMLDMALLERERGNEIGFLAALRDSAKLDPSNKEAQSLVAQHYSIRIPEASTRMRLQTRVLYADPLDPHVHILIARMCAAEGATDVAWRFLNNGVSIFRIDQGALPELLREQELSLLWQYEGAQEILDRLNPVLSDERATLRAKIEARIAAEEPIDDLKHPDEVRYSAGIDRIRLLAAYVLEDQETLDSVLLDLQRGLLDDFNTTQELMAKRGADEKALTYAYLQKVVDFQTMRAIVGVSAAVIKADMARTIERAPELEEFFRPFEPFSLYAEGKFEEARSYATEKLLPSSARDLLIALCTDKLGERDASIEQFRRLALEYPLEAGGALARTRLQALTGKANQLTEEGAKMRQIGASIPLWMDSMIRHPENTMALRVEPSASSYVSGEETRVQVRLENLTSIPLSVGGAHPIDSNLLITPGFWEIDSAFRGNGKSRVVDLGRRLRLGPLEELVIELEPDSIQTRWLIQSQPLHAVRQRWRVLQGFKPYPGGGLVNSPFSLVTETEMIERRVLPESLLGVDGILEGLGDEDPEVVRRSVLGAGGVMYNSNRRDDLSETDLDQIAGALLRVYEKVDSNTKIWMLGVLPPKAVNGAMEAFDEGVERMVVADALIDQDYDPALLSMVMVTRADSMNSGSIEVALGHSDPRLVSMAGHILDRMEETELFYSIVRDPYRAFAPDLSESDGFSEFGS